MVGLIFSRSLFQFMTFPDRFLWGVSSCAFQFEMGDPSKTNLDENTDWYAWVHDKKNIQKGIASGDFPEDGPNYWTLYKKDHEIASDLGLNCVRIGVEWSRIFPKTTEVIAVDVKRADDQRVMEIAADDSAMEKLARLADTSTVNHYREIITDLRQRKIKPTVCLNHFALPLWIHDPIALRDSGQRTVPRGWCDEKTVVEFWKFASYAAWKLGDLVDSWVTINEPVVAAYGYVVPEYHFPPGKRDFKAFKKVMCNLAVAHARAYDGIKYWDDVKADSDSASPADVGLVQNIAPMMPHRQKDGGVARFTSHIHNSYFLEAVTNGWLDEDLNGIRDEQETKKYLVDRVDWFGVNY